MYKISNDLLIYQGKENVLLYNYAIQSCCIVKKQLYNELEKDGNLVTTIHETNKKKLIEKGIIYENIEEYTKKKDIWKKKYLNDCESSNTSIKEVYWHITQRCNLRCEYCYNKENLNGKKELSISKIEEIADRLHDMGVQSIILTGGEVLIREDIESICKLLNKFSVTILTNGVLLDKKYGILENINNMIISLDTLDDKKNLRKGLDILELIDNLKGVDMKYRNKISIRSVVHNGDLNSWRDIKKFCEENQFGFLQSVFIPNNSNEIEMIPDVLCLEIVGNEQGIKPVTCGAGKNIISIDAEGDVYPCQTLLKKGFKIGNILDDEIEKTIHNQCIVQRLKKRNVYTLTECEECSYRHICGGGCPAISYNLYSDINMSPLPMCEIYKMRIDKSFEIILEKYESKNLVQSMLQEMKENAINNR